MEGMWSDRDAFCPDDRVRATEQWQLTSPSRAKNYDVARPTQPMAQEPSDTATIGLAAGPCPAFGVTLIQKLGLIRKRQFEPWCQLQVGA